VPDAVVGQLHSKSSNRATLLTVKEQPFHKSSINGQVYLQMFAELLL
jgi:hypothetical protein